MEDDDTEPDEGDTVGALEERDAVKAPEEEDDQAAQPPIWDKMYYFKKN